jgi:hypothetical protein
MKIEQQRKGKEKDGASLMQTRYMFTIEVE